MWCIYNGSSSSAFLTVLQELNLFLIHSLPAMFFLSAVSVLLVQATRSSERTITRPRSPPLPAHLKNAPSVPPSRAPSQRATRTPPAPPAPPKVEPSRSRASGKAPPPTKSSPKTTAKTPTTSRSSRVSYWLLEVGH